LNVEVTGELNESINQSINQSIIHSIIRVVASSTEGTKKNPQIPDTHVNPFFWKKFPESLKNYFSLQQESTTNYNSHNTLKLKYNHFL